MIDTSSGKLIGTALIVSQDAVATRQLAEAMQELALSVEVCIKVSDSLDRVNHSKLEVAFIDFSLGNVLQQVRGSASNRNAVTFAITGNSAETEYALRAGSTLRSRPLTFDSIRRTLNAAYGLIVRERRRYFRYPISVPAAAHRKGESEIFRLHSQNRKNTGNYPLEAARNDSRTEEQYRKSDERKFTSPKEH